MRLDKYLAAYAGMSRKEARRAVRSGRVLVNAEVAGTESCQVDGHALVMLDGERILGEEFVYFMMNKPAGVISATKDAREKTVLDLMSEERRGLFPMGRLDKDTEGLLILTDDGALAHRLLSPAYHVDKTYEVWYEGELGEHAVTEFSEGLEIGERRRTKSAKLEPLAPGRARLTIAEGKYHQVKRMFAVMGTRVTALRRIGMAGLRLDPALAPGEYRRLTEEEVCRLRQQGEKKEREECHG